MFRIYYDIGITCQNRILYDPVPIFKLYNYIRTYNIPLEDININDVIKINNIDQIIVNKDSDGFFFAPGIEEHNGLAKLNYSININNKTYMLSFDPYSIDTDQILIGSIILYNVLSAKFNINDSIRIISDQHTIVNMQYAKIKDINNEFNKYIHRSSYTNISLFTNVKLLDWLNKTNNLYIHSIDTCKNDIKIRLGLRIFGGLPYRDTSFAANQYKMILKDVTTNTFIEQIIPQFFSYNISDKHNYELFIYDSSDNQPLLINDEASIFPIKLDLTNPTIYIDQEENTPQPIEPLNIITQPLFG